MADGASFMIDGPALTREGDRLVRAYLTAGTEAVGDATRNLEKRLEAATQSAVPGRLWRAWQSSGYPQRGPAQNPVGTIWLKGGTRTRGAVQFWTQPGQVRGKAGQFLAVPLPAAGSRGRGRDLTPGEWERRTGQRLRFVYRPGRASLLVADNGTLNMKSGTFRQNTARRQAAGRLTTTIPIFVLIPVLKHRNAFAIDPLVRESEGEMAKLFLSHVATAGRLAGAYGGG